MAKKPQRVKLLEASLQIQLNAALVTRRKLSDARHQHGLRDEQLAFITNAEWRELESEHEDEMRSLVLALSGLDPSATRIARAAQLWLAGGTETPQQRAEMDWAMTVAAAKEIVATHDEEIATTATAEAIVRAGRRRRNEED